MNYIDKHDLVMAFHADQTAQLEDSIQECLNERYGHSGLGSDASVPTEMELSASAPVCLAFEAFMSFLKEEARRESRFHAESPLGWSLVTAYKSELRKVAVEYIYSKEMVGLDSTVLALPDDLEAV